MQVCFILPILPVLNIAAAAALARIWNNRHKTAALAATTAAFLLVAGSILATTVMLIVSRHNYPGGQALASLHRWQALHGNPLLESLKVHIDVLPAMTGVSRFGQLDCPWTYSKVSEHLLILASGITCSLAVSDSV